MSHHPDPISAKRDSRTDHDPHSFTLAITSPIRLESVTNASRWSPIMFDGGVFPQLSSPLLLTQHVIEPV
jgi:hypothetical protein